MKATKTVLENAKKLLTGVDFIIEIPIEQDLATHIKGQLVRGVELDKNILDWICENLPYFPSKFLRTLAEYRVEKNDRGTFLCFNMYIFSVKSFLEMLGKIDEMSGGFEITPPDITDYMEDPKF